MDGALFRFPFCSIPSTSQHFPSSTIKYPFISPLLHLHSSPASATRLSTHSSQGNNHRFRCRFHCRVFSSSIPGDIPTLEPDDSNLDSDTQKAILRGGEQVTSVLEEMIKLLEDMEMNEASEAVAVEIAAQGVIGKRVDEMESGFIMALDYMIQLAETDNDDKRMSLLEVIKQTVLDHLTKKCPPQVQVIGLLCRTPLKESRHELLRRVAGGGGVFKGENDLKVQLPGANLNDIANQADDLLETMEARPTIPDRKLLARLVLIREEARNMMGGGILDERNDRGLSTLPEAEVNFLSKLVALRPGKNVQAMIQNVLQGKDEGADSTGVDTMDSGSQRQQTLSGIAGKVCCDSLIYSLIVMYEGYDQSKRALESNFMVRTNPAYVYVLATYSRIPLLLVGGDAFNLFSTPMGGEHSCKYSFTTTLSVKTMHTRTTVGISL